MDSERARPLAAFVLVAMLCAFIVTVGMQRHHPRADPLAHVAVSPAAPATRVVESTIVLGSVLTAKPTQPSGSGGTLTSSGGAALRRGSTGSSSASSTAAAGRALAREWSHQHPSGPSTQPVAASHATDSTGRTPTSPATSSGPDPAANEQAGQPEQPAAVVLRPRGNDQGAGRQSEDHRHPVAQHASNPNVQGLRALAGAGVVQAWQEAVAAVIESYGGRAADPAHLPGTRPDGSRGR